MTGRRAHRRSPWRFDVWGIEHVALVTPGQAAELDRRARDGGVAEQVLMESAGRAAAAIVTGAWPAGHVGVVAGSGNNGGDAAVLARTLHAWGRGVTLFATGSRPPDPALFHGFRIQVLPGEVTGADLRGCDVLVDGILGTGASGAPRGLAAAAIAAMNASGRPIVALDLPSGVDAESGRVPAEAVRAAMTIQFGWPKIGLLFHPARALCGRLIAVEIGFPPYEAWGEDSAALITPAWASRRLPPRRQDAHKGTAGRLLILAGSQGMAGAALIAAEAACRAGAGLVRVASDPSNRLVLQTAVPEATFLDRDHLDAEDTSTVHALVAGPGLGADGGGRSALEAALERTGRVPVALDADALNLFARDATALRRLSGMRDILLTPHAAELARLTGQSIDEIVADPPAAARAAADAFGCSVLLKGQPSIIASPGQPMLVNSVGSSDLASAGMGDQLAGVIGAFLAAGLNARDAAAVALYHGARAADLARLGRSLSPRDVSLHLPAAFERPGARHPPFGLSFVTMDQPPRW
jgi:NAD(P)H-hydrate epimerase